MPRRFSARTRKPLIETLEGRQLLSTTIFGVTVSNQLLQFTAESATLAANPLAITGIAADERIVGIDVRPATGELYALGQRFTGGPGFAGEGNIYKLNPTTGAATLITPTPFELNGEGYDLDVDHTFDRIRVVSTADQNLRIHPDNGSVTVRSNLDYPTTDVARSVDPDASPNISGLAFTGNFTSDPALAYGIDTGTDRLVSIPDIDGLGTMNSAASPLGVDVEFVGFDIGNGAGAAAYAAITPVGSDTTSLYTVNLSTGAATLIGPIGGIGSVREIAVLPPAVQFAAANATVAEAGGSVVVTVTRTNGTTGPLTVNYATSDISATAGADYTAVTAGTLNFAAGVETATITIPVADDATVEGLEAFGVTLTGVTAGTTIIAPAMIVVTINDDDSGVIVQPEPPGTPGDPNIPNVLTINGTSGDDTITFLKAPNRQVEIILNGTSLGVFAQQEIVVLGKAGNDTIDFAKSKTSVRVYGEEGNDIITGSKKNDILVGGAGNDTVFAGGGRDLIFGGDGADIIDAGGSNDILVGGLSTFDQVGATAAAKTLLTTWVTTKGKYTTRVAAVTDQQAALGTGTTSDDTDADTLTPGGGTDLLFADTNGTAVDILIGRSTKESLVELA